MADIINNIHDLVVDIVSVGSFPITDKQLHFISMAIIGISIFAITHFTFKKLAKYSITAISFIYTFTVMIVVVFAIEIQQKLTNRGNMEFGDIVYGLYGFIYVFLIYLFIKLAIRLSKYFFSKYTEKDKLKDSTDETY